ncbi:MAG: Sir2 silent information regulator family NAD-dependent deacetylase, partial [Aeriscardovia sp.]|nr:Sir2 silent information regulator family NAD-dependent deacetylase [Aeriscardovia sp.]
MEEKTVAQKVEKLRFALNEADAVLVGAGAGTSIAAGLATSGERFDRFFGDFSAKYQMKDMYEGAECSFESPGEQWAYLSRFIYLNRYEKAPLPVYEKLYELLDGGEGKPKKDYFILTTNQDHQFQKAGFEKERIFFTQGDLGLLQCSRPCLPRIYENKSKVV